jgi:hypothetical protein
MIISGFQAPSDMKASISGISQIYDVKRSGPVDRSCTIIYK